MSGVVILALVALVVGIFIGARFGRIILLASLVVIALWALLNLPNIIAVIGKAQNIAKILGL